MKDIYSPIEIDQEWDDMAPMADGGTTAVADPVVAAATQSIPVQSDDSQNNMSMQNPAYDVAEMSIEHTNPPVSNTSAQASNDTFNISDTGSTMPEGNATSSSVAVAENASSAKPMTKIDVTSADQAPAAISSAEPGDTFMPSIAPEGGVRSDMTFSDEPAKKPEPIDTKQPKYDLPVSPLSDKKDSEYKKEAEKMLKESPKPKAVHKAKDSDDATDKRFSAAVDEWNKAKTRTHERLTTLKTDIESQIDSMKEQIANLEAKVSLKEDERDRVETQLSELGDVS